MSQIVGARKPSLLEVLAQQAAQDKGPVVIPAEPDPIVHTVKESLFDQLLRDVGDVKLSEINQS